MQTYIETNEVSPFDMRILITGSNGFTGHYVTSELLADENVNEVVSLTSDLTDSNAVSAEIKQIQPEAVVHLAAITFVQHGKINDFYRVNLIGTRNLLKAIAHSAPNITSILLASSANVYGNQTAGKLTENITPNPANDYAVSKLAMENMASLWTDRLPLFIVRPFNYTGVGQNSQFLIPKIIKHFQNKANVIELGNLDVSREFNDVRTIAKIYKELLLETIPVGETCNICSGNAYSIREIIALCEKITGHHIEINVNPTLARKNEVNVLMGNNQKLLTLTTTWQAPSLEQTLRWMLNDNWMNLA